MERWHDYFVKISKVELEYSPISCGFLSTAEEMEAALKKMEPGEATGRLRLADQNHSLDTFVVNTQYQCHMVLWLHFRMQLELC